MEKVLVIGAGGVGAVAVVKMAMHPEIFKDITLASRTLSKQNFAIAVVYNCIAVPIALAGFATPLAAALAMSASSITVLLNSQRMRFVK
jgi:Cu2+-exporting ATPase